MKRKLTQLAARNFKGLDFDLTLEGAVVFVGENFAGKSARADAVRLLLLGHLPELGKTARATFSLASGRELLVRGTLSDGSELLRRWYLKGDTVKTEEAGFEHFSDPEALLAMLDAGAYFGLSDRERVDLVLANVSTAGISVPDAASIRGTLALALGGLDEKASGWFTVTADGTVPAAAKKRPQDYVDALLEFAKEEAKERRAEVLRFEKTALGLAQLRGADAEKGKTPAELEAEIATAEQVRGEITRKVAEARAEARASGETLRRREGIERELASASDVVAERDTLRAALETAELECDDLARQIAEFDQAGDQTVLGNARLEQARLSERIARTREEVRTALREVDGLEAQTVCPYCGASGDGWKALKKAELVSRIDAGTAELARLETALSVASTEVAAAEGVVTRARGISARLASATGRREAVAGKVRGFEAKAARISALQETLASLPAPDPDAEKRLEALEKALWDAEEPLRTLRGKLTLAKGREAEALRFADAERARSEAEKALAVAKRAAETLEKLRADLVERIFRPLLDEANALFPGVLQTPIAYHEGEIGTWRAGAWVGHKTFSGTEKALTYGAIQIALAARAPFRILILDELGRLDDMNARKVNSAVARALEAGVLDQFVGIDAGRADLHRETKAFRVQEVTS